MKNVNVLVVFFLMCLLTGCKDGSDSGSNGSLGSGPDVNMNDAGKDSNNSGPDKDKDAPLPSDLPLHQDINYTEISRYLFEAHQDDCKYNEYYYLYALSKRILLGKEKNDEWVDAVDVTLLLNRDFTYTVQFIKHKFFKSTIGSLEYVQDKQDPIIINGEWFAVYGRGIDIPQLGKGFINKYTFNDHPVTNFEFEFLNLEKPELQELTNRSITFNYTFTFTPIEGSEHVLKYKCP